jgi:hypothetical protein
MITGNKICVVALAVNAPFAYTRELARVGVREQSAGAVELKTVDLRDLNNNRDEVAPPDDGTRVHLAGQKDVASQASGTTKTVGRITRQ